MRFLVSCLLLASCSDPGPGPVNPPAPVLNAREGHAMAYDEARQQLLLFGGTGPDDTSTAQNDHASMFAWDGTTWTQVSPSGPAARHHASMAYDVARQRIVLHGGLSGRFPNEILRTDTWEWDGLAWTRRATTGPTARAHQSMAYDRARQRVVLYGGFSASAGELRDIWEWDGSVWTATGGATASDRIARNIAFDESAPARLLLFSVQTPGPAGPVLTDVWNGSAVTASGLPAPDCAPPPNALVSRGAAGLLFFGCAGPVSSSLWTLASGTWTAASGIQPPARSGHALAFDRDRNVVVMFGGALADGTRLDETWELSGSAWTQRAGAPAPQISVGGTYPTTVTMVADSCPGTVIMNNPTIITHTAGQAAFALAHAVIRASGTVAGNGAFSTTQSVQNLGGTNYYIDISGQFSVTGLEALVHISVGDPGPGRCGYTVRWVGTKQGNPNVIPG